MLIKNVEYKTYVCTYDTLQETLDKYGVAVIPNVLTKEECKNTIDDMYSTLEYMSSNLECPINRNDPNTYKSLFSFSPKHGMLLQHHGIGHAQFIWNVRQHKNVIKGFSTLYNTDQLSVSFDGVAIGFPPEITNRGYHNEEWFHTDQSYTKKGKKCIQGFVNFFPVHQGDATLCILEGSHIYHQSFGERFQITDKKDWYLLNDEELDIYMNEYQCKPVCVTCGEGDMVFFDSRTIHQGRAVVKGNRETPNQRLAIYVCMQPDDGLTSVMRKKKEKYFHHMRMTSHWPLKIKVFGKPRLYPGQVEQPIINPIPPILTDIGEKLAGLKSYTK